MKYMHELADWPAFTWDHKKLAVSLATVHHKIGTHLGRMKSLGFELRNEAYVISLRDEVVKSSAIEGEHLNPEDVRSSIAQKLGLDIAGVSQPSREVDGIVEMMLDATRKSDEVLDAKRLFGWHAALFPTGHSSLYRITVGAWRTDDKGPMQVVSGPIGREKVHFQAPDASRIEVEMNGFLDWFNTTRDIDPVLKAAVAHLWFVTIHPFADGNGRIARAIADMALARADGSKERYYSMSSGIEAQRKKYYLELESTQHRNLDITQWLTWFLECLDQTLDDAELMLSSVLHKSKLWQQINRNPVNDRQRKVINRMLDHFKGHLTTSKYATIAKCSGDTALRDITELLGRGIIIKNEAGGRSTSYRLVDANTLDQLS